MGQQELDGESGRYARAMVGTSGTGRLATDLDITADTAGDLRRWLLRVVDPTFR